MMQTILIIEDNAEVRENTAELLEVNNYFVLTAKNGGEGFELAKKHLPDLILCDIMMPETDGKMFLKLAKANKAVKEIPLIFFSAGTAPEIQREILKSANGFLKKPFSEQELLTKIQTSLTSG